MSKPKKKITPWTMFVTKVDWTVCALATAIYIVSSILMIFLGDKESLSVCLFVATLMYCTFFFLPLGSIYLDCYEAWCKREVRKDRPLYKADFMKIEKHLEKDPTKQFWEQFCEQHGYHPENAMRQYKKYLYNKINPE
jgi:hypothetical protein